MATQSLDQVAWDYIMASPRDQVLHSRVLINAGATAVFPLLRAGLRTVQDFNPLHTQGGARPDRQAAESIWIYQIAEPTLKSIYMIMKAIGQPAYDALCRALWDSDDRLKVYAAVILLQEPHPTSRTAKQVQDAFNGITSRDRNKKYFMESGIFIALSNILALSGDTRHQKLLEDTAAEQSHIVEQALETTRNTLLLYLIR